jgi:hypothetical protein
VSARHRAGGWLRPARGRLEQPAGRHTQEYVDAARVLAAMRPAFALQFHGDGLYPLGEPNRVTHDRELFEALERPGNDPHVR